MELGNEERVTLFCEKFKKTGVQKLHKARYKLKRERYKTKHAKNWLLYSLGGALLMTFEIQPKELKFSNDYNILLCKIGI